jgi:hypothetical protein
LTVRRPVLLSLLTAAALAACAGSASAGQWLAPTPISSFEAFAARPIVAMDDSGDAVAVWILETNAEVVQASVRPAGGTWSPPRTLSEPAAEIEGARVAIDAAGEATALWDYVGGGTGLMQASTYTPGGGWGPARNVSLPGAKAYGPVVAMAKGRAIALWAREEGGHYVTQESTKLTGGEWLAPIALSSPGGKAENGDVAMNEAGDAVATWSEEPVGGTVGVYSSNLIPGTNSWTGAVRLNPAGQKGFAAPVAIAPDGSATVAWEENTGASNFVVESVSRVGAGGAWSAPVAISPKEGFAIDPQLAVNAAGEATAVWEVGEGGGRYSVAGARRVGGTWLPSSALVPSSEEIFSYAVALDGAGHALAVVGRDDGNVPAAESIEGNAGGGWSGRRPLGSGSTNVADVALDPAGDGVAAWETDGDEVVGITAAGYDGAGPQLRSLSVPAAGTAGVPLAFAVAPLDTWSAVASVEWEFGDGTKAAGAQASHAFAAAGDYQVTVRATDSLGNVSVAHAAVQVAAAPKPARAARAGRLVLVKGAFALPKLSCPAGAATCAGVVRLTFAPKKSKARARVARASRPGAKRVLLGKARFSVAAGKHQTVRVKLGRKGLALVRRAPKGLPARLEGTGVATRAVVLKPAPKKKHRPHH